MLYQLINKFSMVVIETLLDYQRIYWYIQVHVQLCVYRGIYIYMCVYLCICIYVYVCICMGITKYIYIYY